MIQLLKDIFSSEKVNIGELIANGAVVLDVRSKGEYQGGHIKKSMNVPLDQLSSNLKRLDPNKPIITCCASGMRSGSAVSILKSNGFTQVYNGGSWLNLRQYEN